MKSLPQNTSSQPEWDNKLIQDLAYIKKNLRYPISIKLLLPGMLIFISFTASFCIIANIFVNTLHRGTLSFPATFAIFMLLFIGTITMVRSLGSLRFIVVATPYFMAENMAVLNRFLESQHLVVFRHPDAPEVFQIISKSIDVFKDSREVLVFIADDNRILINSHFTENKQTMQRHHKEMARMLDEYIRNGEQSMSVKRQR